MAEAPDVGLVCIGSRWHAYDMEISQVRTSSTHGINPETMPKGLYMCLVIPTCGTKKALVMYRLDRLFVYTEGIHVKVTVTSAVLMPKIPPVVVSMTQ